TTAPGLLSIGRWDRRPQHRLGHFRGLQTFSHVRFVPKAGIGGRERQLLSYWASSPSRFGCAGAFSPNGTLSFSPSRGRLWPIQRLVLRIVTNQPGRRADFALDADFPLLSVIFIQSIAQPIGHRVADDHYCLARRRFQFTRRRRLRVIDGWRWTIAARAG